MSSGVHRSKRHRDLIVASKREGWCVINNQYKVYEWDALERQKGRLLFKLKQDGDWMERQCCHPCIRGYTLNALLPNR